MRQLSTILMCLVIVSFSTNALLADITSDIVAYWPLDDNANDAIGGHDGALVGGASFVSDNARGKVLEVDGVDGHVEVPHADDLIFGQTDSYTLSLWVNVLMLPGHWAGVVNKSRDASPWYGLWVNSSNQWVAGGTNIIGSNVSADTWHHLVLVQDGSANTRTVYLNGNIDITGTAIDATGGGDLWMGGAKSVSEYINARIDDVILYSRPLASGDAEELLAGSPTAVDPSAKLTTKWGVLKGRSQ
jgi:hypothetical protein